MGFNGWGHMYSENANGAGGQKSPFNPISPKNSVEISTHFFDEMGSVENSPCRQQEECSWRLRQRKRTPKRTLAGFQSLARNKSNIYPTSKRSHQGRGRHKEFTSAAAISFHFTKFAPCLLVGGYSLQQEVKLNPVSLFSFHPLFQREDRLLLMHQSFFQKNAEYIWLLALQIRLQFSLCCRFV